MRPSLPWTVAVQQIRPLDGWPCLLRVAGQTVQPGDGYHNSGQQRQGAVHLLLKCTVSGVGEFVYDGRSQAVPAGWAFLTWIADPAMIYRYPDQTREPWSFVYAAMTCDRAMIDGLLGRYGHLFPTPVDGPVVRRLLALRRPPGSHLDLDAATGAVLVTETIADLARAAASALCPEAAAAARRVAEARRLVEATLPHVPSVGELAVRLGVSREVLGRSFRAVLGRSPQVCLATWHMEQAAALLLDRRWSVTRVATALGFDTPSHFARAFRRRFGLSPGDYRRSGGA